MTRHRSPHFSHHISKASPYTSTLSLPASLFFFFNDPATPEIYPFSLPDPLPIPSARMRRVEMDDPSSRMRRIEADDFGEPAPRSRRRAAAEPMPMYDDAPRGRRRAEPEYDDEIGRAHV